MNLPNRISLARILMTPVMLVFFLLDDVIPYGIAPLLATLIFLVAAASDGVDGHIARSRGMVTTLGKFLDSIADKVLCVTAMVMILIKAPILAEFPSVGICLTVLCCIHIARDFLISALRQLAAAGGRILAADKWGKIKAVFDYASLPILMSATAISELCGISPLYLYLVGFSLFGAATVLSIVSGAHYLIKNRALFAV